MDASFAALRIGSAPLKVEQCAIPIGQDVQFQVVKWQGRQTVL